MVPDLDNSTELTDQQMDDLVDRMETPRGTQGDEGIPMSAPAEKEQEAPKTFEFVHNGKKVSGTVEQFTKWAQQGYDYPQKMQAFNQERQKWEQLKQEHEKSYGPYRQVDEWARKNPTQWNKFTQLWQQNLQGGQSQGQQAAQAVSTDPRIDQVIEQINNQIAPFLSTVAEERQKAEIQKHDELLDSTVKSIREKYKDLDFDQVDDSGYSLEQKVLKHALDHDINNFKTAFNDYYHEHILPNKLEQERAQAKQDVSRSVQSRTKQGFLGETQIPARSAPARNIKEQSYNDLAAEGLAELRSGALKVGRR